MSQTESPHEPLLEMATPQLYRRNAFRVLGVPVSASLRDVQREQDRRAKRLRLGLADVGDAGGALALDPRPDEAEMEAALERLSNPADRLLDELFWFWPLEEGTADDPALAAIQRGDVGAAREIWLARAAGGADVVAVHNLAVLDHVEALDGEAQLAASGIDGRAYRGLVELWDRALDRWRVVIEGESFWRAVRARVRAMDDRQVTTGSVARMREMLPLALLLVNARLACAAAERADAVGTGRHTGLLRGAGFDDETSSRALSEAVQPIRKRVHAAIETARQMAKEAPQRAQQAARQLHRQAAPALAALDALLPADDLMRAGVHDAVAEVLLDATVSYGNTTNDWGETLALLDLVERVSVGDVVKADAARYATTVRENQEASDDWCDPGYWDLPAELTDRLEEARISARAADYQGALGILLSLDPPAVGRPLRRCVAYTLDGLAMRMREDGVEEFNLPTMRIALFQATLAVRGSVPVPSPEMQLWQLPECPSCNGRHSYTSWLSGEYSGQRFWMCSTCGADHDREREVKRGKLRAAVVAALEHALLAAELDPHSRRIRKRVETLTKDAREIGAKVPSSGALRRRLASGATARWVTRELEPRPADVSCHFCRQREPDDACGITVEMCGDVREVELLFGKGTEYRRATVRVPRCRPCRDVHGEWPARAARWNRARDAAISDESFPALVADLAGHSQRVGDATCRVEQLKKEATAAREALATAEAIGTHCPHCGAEDGSAWSRGLCRTCDEGMFGLDFATLLCVALVTYIAFVGAFLIQRELGWVSVAALQLRAVVAAAVGIGLVLALAARQRRSRERLSAAREAALLRQRAAAVDGARARMGALPPPESARKALTEAVSGRNVASNALARARVQAAAAFEATNPPPRLPDGIRPEAAFVEFERIAELRAAGWAFGESPDRAGAEPGDRSGAVAGLARGGETSGGAIPISPMEARTT